MTNNTRITPEKVGHIARRVATEAAYVVTGLADVLAGTVKDVVNSGRTSYTERKAAGQAPVKDYAKQMPDQLKGLVGEVKEAYQSLSARGRTVFSDGFSSTAHRPAAPTAGKPGEYEQPPG